MERIGRRSVLRTAASFAVAGLLAWGGAIVPALADEAEEPSISAAQDENREISADSSNEYTSLVDDLLLGQDTTLADSARLDQLLSPEDSAKSESGVDAKETLSSTVVTEGEVSGEGLSTMSDSSGSEVYSNGYNKTYLTEEDAESGYWLSTHGLGYTYHSFEIPVKKSRIAVDFYYERWLDDEFAHKLEIIDHYGNVLLDVALPDGYPLRGTVEVPEGYAHVVLTGVSASYRSISYAAKFAIAYHVLESYDIADANVSGIVAKSYNGRAQTQNIKVTTTQKSKEDLSVSTATLWQGSDYEVSYANNVNPGTATMTITGIGQYTGSKRVTFKIKSSSSISLAAQTKTYTGKKLAYSGKVTRSGSAGAVTYTYYADAACTRKATPKDVGTYYVRANLAADSTHVAATSAATKFVITKAANPMAAKASKKTAKLAAVKKKAVTVARPMSVSKAQGKLSYTKVAKGSAKRLTVNKNNGKVTVKKGTKKGTYKVKIKVTAKGNKNYKAASKTVTCTVVVK